MNGDFFDQAKRKARELGKQFAPRVQDALHQSQIQAEDALDELRGFVRKAARTIRDDVNRRP